MHAKGARRAPWREAHNGWGPGSSPWWGSRGRSPRKLWAFPLKMIEVLMYFGQNKAPILTVGITEYDHKCHETWTYFILAGKHTKLCFDSYLKNTKKTSIAPICIVVQNWCNFKWNSKLWVKKYKRFLVLWQCRTGFLSLVSSREYAKHSGD